MPSLTDSQNRPYSGLVNTIVPAIVVENRDPDKLGRVQVKFPTLPGAPVSYWLRLAVPNGGKDRGMYALPEIDDEVVVAFLMGSQDKGVIIGQCWNGVDTPVAEGDGGSPDKGHTVSGSPGASTEFTTGSTDYEKNDRRCWKSRSGHLFCFDDTEGSETIHLWDKDRKIGLVFDTAKESLFIMNSGKDIHIRAKQDIYLEADRDIKLFAGNDIITHAKNNTKWKADVDFSFEAGAKGDIKSGAKMSVKAGADFALKADVNVKLESSAKTDIKAGASASVKASASLKIGAATIAIN